MTTNLKRVEKCADRADLTVLLLWLCAAGALSCLVMWDVGHGLGEWAVCLVLFFMAALPGLLLYAVLHLVHRHRIRKLITSFCSLQAFEAETFVPLGRDLAFSDHYLIYLSRKPVMIRKSDVRQADVYEDRVILLGDLRVPFSYLTRSRETAAVLQQWAASEWVCPHCGSTMPSSYAFCTECGTARPSFSKEEQDSSRAGRRILILAVLVLLAAALVLVLIGVRKPERKGPELEADGYLAVQCEQTLNPDTAEGDNGGSLFDIINGSAKL